MKTEKRKIGDLGEDLACKYLVERGLKIVERNYLKPYGEIDIVACAKDGRVHFVEVKSVTREIGDDVSRVTAGYAPESNIHYQKIKRLIKTAQVYLLEKRLTGAWQIDALAVYIDPVSQKSLFRYTEHINIM